MQYKMIVSDVDGTLFPPGNQLRSDTVEWVNRYQEAGGVFTIATGRMKTAIDPFIRELNIRVPVIVYNGAQIVEPATNRVLHSETVNPAIAAMVVDMLKEYDVDAIFHQHLNAWVSQHTPIIERHMLKIGVRMEIQRDLDWLIRQPLNKILIIGEPGVLDEYHDALVARTGGDFQPIYSGSRYLEILPDGASKGNALWKLCGMTGISMQDTLTIGDEQNDISMIRAAGLGIAVANAHSRLLPYADRVTRFPYNRGVEEVLKWQVD